MVPIRLLIVDDQSIFLDGLEALLTQDPELHIVGRANNGVEAVRKARELVPHVVLMDISMPEMDGIDATRAMIKANKNVRVLVLSMYNNRDFVNELLDAGAHGYLLKNTGKEELREAIRTVAQGGRYLARAVEPLVGPSGDGSAAEPHASLTKREKEIIHMVVQEMTTQEIAERLSLSAQTVDTHRKNIMHKLNVRNTAGLVKYALERGWGDR
jgi:two-component system nitrate/nitrite response regulator NarL